jgi:hypothetical protein
MILCLAIFIAGISGCSKVSPVQPNTVEKKLSPYDGPGGFAMSYLKGLAKTKGATEVKSGENAKFDLGSIKGSTAFYFLLYNIGNRPITNVSLTIADTMFSLYPSKIDTLVPGTDIGILPIVKVNAFHGTSIDGVGSRSLMKMGLNSATLAIQGTTKTQSGADTAVSLSVGLRVQAMVMNFKVSGLGGVVNLESPAMSAMGRFLSDSAQSVSMPSAWPVYYPGNFNFDKLKGSGCYRSEARDTAIKILNSGNAALRVMQYPSGSFPSVSASIPPGDSLTIPHAAGDFIIDGNHTVADPQKITLHTDGKCYFEFTAPPAPTCGTFFDWNAFKMFGAQSGCANVQITMHRLDSDTTLMYWERKGQCADTTSLYALFYMSPDSMVAQYKETSSGPVEKYVNQTFKDLLTQLREGSK